MTSQKLAVPASVVDVLRVPTLASRAGTDHDDSYHRQQLVVVVAHKLIRVGDDYCLLCGGQCFDRALIKGRGTSSSG